MSGPDGSSALVAARSWAQGTMFGTMAAVIAVASVGFGMLSGRMSVRRGATVVFGCFVLFGAPSIAAGLSGLAGGGGGGAVAIAPLPPPPAIPPIAAKPATDDPYAGAAVPQRR